MTTNEVALNEVMKETADAIREKKGTTDKIAPINLQRRLEGLPQVALGKVEARMWSIWM